MRNWMGLILLVNFWNPATWANDPTDAYTGSASDLATVKGARPDRDFQAAAQTKMQDFLARRGLSPDQLYHWIQNQARNFFSAYAAGNRGDLIAEKGAGRTAGRNFIYMTSPGLTGQIEIPGNLDPARVQDAINRGRASAVMGAGYRAGVARAAQIGGGFSVPRVGGGAAD